MKTLHTNFAFNLWLPIYQASLAATSVEPGLEGSIATGYHRLGQQRLKTIDIKYRFKVGIREYVTMPWARPALNGGNSRTKYCSWSDRASWIATLPLFKVVRVPLSINQGIRDSSTLMTVCDLFLKMVRLVCSLTIPSTQRWMNLVKL
mmetsp:Transcript_18214/g.37999  ORF Transcript_18214/g.37999 Transcript_18214/m.37999 type:complete len:148 (+) Transcript_18214:1608-2051(+)